MNNIKISKSVLCALFLFGTTISCKREVEINAESQSSVHYYTGGDEDKVQGVVSTDDGGAVYVGKAGSNAFMMKVDADGKQLWYRQYGGENIEEFKSAIATSDGGYLAIGRNNTIDNGQSLGAAIDYVVKTDANGNMLWQNSYLANFSYLESVIESDSGDFLITGSVYSIQSGGSWDVILFSVAPDGSFKWGYAYSDQYLKTIPPFYASKSYYQQFASDMFFAPNGDLIIAGTMSPSIISVEANKFVTFFMVIDPTTYSIKNLYPYYDYQRGWNWYRLKNRDERFNVRVITGSDGYYVATTVEDDNSLMRVQLLKTDFSANLSSPLWVKEYSGLGNAIMYDFADNGDGTYLISGTSTDKYLTLSFPELFDGLQNMVMKVDREGNALWSHYEGSEHDANIGLQIQKSGSGYAVGGFTSLNRSGYHKMYRMELNSDGELLGSKK
ncbi:MAG: hypothetical protein GC181_12525 [Bacteroidetes bacterium]|nr:hypothetical protein [Bacteroidota bacterium]